MRLLRRAFLAAAVVGVVASHTSAQGQPAARNVVLIVTDGLRWQEVFSGAERALISRTPGGVPDTATLLHDYWRDDPEERRAALMPFFWGTIAKEGQLLGNQERGSVVRLENTFKFSYPGYNEIFTGAFDPAINSNEYPPNPNETVLEWLSHKRGYTGKVAAFATWDAFTRILNAGRSRLTVRDGWTPPFAAEGARGERQITIDELYRTSVQYWPNNAFDAPMHLAAKEYIRTRKPRVIFIGYGETDEWAHAGRYDLLLRSAHQVDAFIADLWRTMQSMRQYRGSTAFIITTDHGRGRGPTAWKDHGENVDGAENTWIAMLGPGIAPVGERGSSPAVTSSQIAATIARLLGEDWQSYRPTAGGPLP
ncbi:MAG: AP protein [Gemmatimonadota bacterium]